MLLLGGQKTINISNFGGLCRKQVGVKFVYVLAFSNGKKGTHEPNPSKSQENAGTVPGQSCEYFMCFLVTLTSTRLHIYLGSNQF